jgi:hypothetical protein
MVGLLEVAEVVEAFRVEEVVACMETVEVAEAVCAVGADEAVVEGLDTVLVGDLEEVAVCRPGA